MNNQRIEQAEAFRNEHGYHGGHVVFSDSEIAGWTKHLDRPSAWVPGCVAVDDAGNEYLAVGGNENGGSDIWEYYFVSRKAHPYVPISPEMESQEAAESWLAEHGDDSMRLVKAAFL